MTETPWKDTSPGDVLLDGKGTEWTLLQRDPGSGVVTMQAGTKKWTGIPSGPTANVTVSARAEQERAVRLITHEAGGTVLATRRNDRAEWKVPVDYDDPGTLLAHLYVLHGVPGPSSTGDLPSDLAGLRRLHAGLHDEKLTDPHVHTPDYLDG